MARADDEAEEARGEEWSALVNQVRAKQRESELRRLQWHFFSDRHNAGIRDPRRHTAASLRGFLQALADAELPSDEAVLAPGGEDKQPRKPRVVDVGAAAAVPTCEVEAARARAAAPDGAGAWELLPPAWRPLYERPVRLTYDTRRFDFVAVVREMLECPSDLPLAELHEAQRAQDFEPCPPLRQGMLLAGIPVAPEPSKSKTRAKRDWKGCPLYARFLDLYSQFLREEVLPALGTAAGCADGFEAATQSSPVLRVVMPSPHFATVPHRDCEYGHVPEELNFWMPLTEVWGSNSLFVETFPGREDFHAFEGGAGDIYRWWGNRCSHYAEANTTRSTRVSLDFRVIPRRFWDAAEAAGTLGDTAEGWTRWHGGAMRLGSYYYLERADPSKGAASEEVAGASADLGSE